MAGLNSATLKLLASKGLSVDDIIEVAEALEQKSDPTAAERKRRQRARDKSRRDVTRDPPNDIYSNPPVSSDDETSARRKSKIEKPEDVSDPIWRDFLAHRRAKKAPVSETAIAGIRREAERAGWTLDAALGEVVTRGWQGFKAEWVAAEKSTGPPGGGSYLEHVLQRHGQSVGEAR